MINLSRYFKMRFAQFQRRDQGSNTVGFALIAPLLVGVFLAVVQIANLLNVQTTLIAAANSGARVASTFDATLMDGTAEAIQRLASQGIVDYESVITRRTSQNGITFVEVKITKNYQIPWVGVGLNLLALGKSVDEKSL